MNYEIECDKTLHCHRTWLLPKNCPKTYDEMPWKKPDSVRKRDNKQQRVKDHSPAAVPFRDRRWRRTGCARCGRPCRDALHSIPGRSRLRGSPTATLDLRHIGNSLYHHFTARNFPPGLLECKEISEISTINDKLQVTSRILLLMYAGSHSKACQPLKAKV